MAIVPSDMRAVARAGDKIRAAAIQTGFAASELPSLGTDTANIVGRLALSSPHMKLAAQSIVSGKMRQTSRAQLDPRGSSDIKASMHNARHGVTGRPALVVGTAKVVASTAAAPHHPETKGKPGVATPPGRSPT